MDDHRDLGELHRHLRPLHAVVEDGTTKVARLAGRPVRARVAPDHDQRAYIEELVELQAEWIEADAVVLAAKHGDDLLDHVLAAIAQEVGSLRWERSRLSPSHPNPAIVTSRILAALAKLGEVVLVRAKLGAGRLDVRGHKFQAVAKLFMDVMREALAETVPEPERFVAEFERRMKNWELRAEEIVRGS